MIRLLTALLLPKSSLGLHLLGLQSAALRLQLGHPGRELCHSAAGGASLGQLLGGLL